MFAIIVTTRKCMWEWLQFLCYQTLKLILVADLKKALYHPGFASAWWIWETSLVLIYCVVLQLEKTIIHNFSCRKPHWMPLSHSRFLKSRSVWLSTKDTGTLNYVKCSVSSACLSAWPVWQESTERSCSFICSCFEYIFSVQSLPP